jgi:hypothetical protein
MDFARGFHPGLHGIAKGKMMADYQGYEIRQNSQSGRWEIYWKERKLEPDFATRTAAEDWIDDQFPSHRF